MAYDAEATVTIKAELERAKDAIRKHGHAKYTIQDENGAVCTVGALNIGATGSAYGEGNLRAQRVVEAFIAPERICAWNNQHGRTAEDVIALFDRTIASL